MTQYDKIAEQYKISDKNDNEKKYVITPLLLKVLGDIKGERILDLACGYGYFTRKIKEVYAEEVIGADISEEMIKIALADEKKNPLGIKYFVREVGKMDKIKEFDIVTAIFIIGYAKTKDQLLKIFSDIYENIKESGRFITMLDIFKDQSVLDRRIGDVKFKAKKPLKDGDPFQIIKNVGKDEVILNIIFWSKETCEELLKKVGFKDITWHSPFVSEEGIKKYGKDFLNDYVNAGHFFCLECRK